MVGPRRLLRALVATSALATGAVLVAAGSPPAPAAEPPPDDSSLGVTIGSMTPGSLPATGNIVVSGTVTNRTGETWRDISLYVVDASEIAGTEPMRTPGALRSAMDSPADEVIGERIYETGTPGEVTELAPGATAAYTIVAPATEIEVDSAGVYWFGVHALGTSDSVPQDLVADGRARTFLPHVPTRFDATPVAVSVVLPLTHTLRYAPDGSVADEAAWVRDLTTGRLTRLLDLAEASPGPLTWLVDPAVVDAVAQLAAGNPARSLGPTTPAPSGTATPEPSDEPDPDSGTGTIADSETTRVAARWLDRLAETLDGDEVLALPYGNVDVAATLARDPELLALAQAQRSSTLESLGIETEPVLAAPGGYLDAASIASADPDTRVLVTDRMFGADPPVAADIDGKRVLVTSYGATQGSPGPGPSLTTVGVRQRLLSEAALRAVRSDRVPLVAVLPPRWDLADPTTFWSGLDAPWIDLRTLSGIESATTPAEVSPVDLDYPEEQQRAELTSATVDGVEGLVEAGDTLQSLLLDNTDVAGTITEEALTGLSYHVRYDQTAGQLATTRSRDWVSERLRGVHIDVSDAITLASDDGDFIVTLTNTLDHRVGVSVRARSDDGIQVTAPDEIVLAPGGRGTVQLAARTTDNAIHNVELQVTDSAGNPLGSTADLPIRSSQIGGVIWTIIAVLAALLFLVIGVRLARRVAAARRGVPGTGRRATQQHESGESGEPVPAIEVV